MVLSIGMIVKNEEKYLERCLTALKPILENVDSELIIADTGSTDSTVEIAKKFTDNVFHFEWINDFSAARNSTLERAKGEWYMFIDGDEIIQDCSDIINFFNSGEYKKFRSASYVQRNYKDLNDMNFYSDFRTMRLTAIINNIHFVNAIHENFAVIFAPIRYLDLIVDHYGYVDKDGEEDTGLAKKKSERNLEILFKELEEGEKEGKVLGSVYSQIADCYSWTGDKENALKYLDMGLEKNEKDSQLRLKYFVKKAKIYTGLKEYEKVIKVCEQYFSDDNAARKTQIAADCDIYFLWAGAAYNLKKYDETIAKAAAGFDVYKKYKNGKLNNDALLYCPVDATVTMIKHVSGILAVSCCNLKKYNIANDELKKIPLNELMSDKNFMKLHLNIRIEIMDHTNYNNLPELYFQLDKPNRDLFIDLLLANVFKTEQRPHFLKKLGSIANDNERLSDILKILNDYFGNIGFSTAEITEFIKKYGTVGNEPILILMLQNNLDITPFVCAEDFNVVNCAVNVYTNFSKLDLGSEVFEKYLVNNISEKGVEKATELFYWAVFTAATKKIGITKLIVNYGNIGRRWKELNPEKEPTNFVSFAIMVGDVAELHRKKRYLEGIERFTEIINSTEQSRSESDIKILRYYLTKIEEEAKKSIEMREAVNPALLEIANEFKGNVRELINNWDLNGAESVLDYVANLVPFDPDIEDLRDEITDRKVNYMKYM